MNVLGISAFYHDSAAALIRDGKILAAVQEERFTRRKHDESFPENAIKWCLAQGKIQIAEIDYIVFYEKPLVKFERLLETYLSIAPRGFSSFSKALPVWIKDKLFQKQHLINFLYRMDKSSSKREISQKFLFSEHHLSHAGSAFFPSPFQEALIYTADGVGEWVTTSIATGRENKIDMLKELHFPHSVGLLYSSFTFYCGFKVNSGEYKLMGLAPYGDPIYSGLIKDNLLSINNKDGSFNLNLEYFDFVSGLKMTNQRFDKLLGREPRKPESPLTQFDMDVAASIQQVTEEIVLKQTRYAQSLTGLRNICIAGGVALNCVANGKLLNSGVFENLWVQPASGDAGGAIGAALTCYYQHGKRQRQNPKGSDSMQGAYLGPEFSNEESSKILKNVGAVFHELKQDNMINIVAEALYQNKAIGWFQGRMEFGPRSLGARSIIASPLSADMQKNLNLKVKFRESFRPFAPAVLSEHVKEWFSFDGKSPYMLLVAEVLDSRRKKIKKNEKKMFGIDKLNVVRSDIPAVTHVDFSARIQTVHDKTNKLFHTLLKKFYEKTGCPILVNTSFNIRGEPIVCSPEDAFRCFMGTDLDILVIGNLILYKHEQLDGKLIDYRSNFALD